MTNKKEKEIEPDLYCDDCLHSEDCCWIAESCHCNEFHATVKYSRAIKCKFYSCRRKTL